MEGSRVSESDPPYDCPCCGFPSLTFLRTAVCAICWWEIDGLDLPEETVCHGPNRGYSRAEARENFRSHGHMYAAGSPIGYLAMESAGRARLMAYVRGVQDGARVPDQAMLDRLIAEERASWSKREASASGTVARDDALLRALLAGFEEQRGPPKKL